MTKNRASSKFSNVIRLNVKDLDQKPLIGVSLTLRDINNKLLKRGITNEKGNCVLPWKEGQTPRSIEASYIGFSNFIGQVDQESSLDYTINMLDIFRPIKAGTVWEYSTKKIQAEKMILTKEGRVTILIKVQD